MRSLAFAALALAACKAKGTDDATRTGRDPVHTNAEGAAVAPAAGSPDAAIEAVFGVLGRIDLAIRERDPAKLAPSIAPGYIAVACGAAGTFASPEAAAAARITRPHAPAHWRVALAADGTMAWATDATDDAHADATALEVLALVDHRWLLVASGATGKSRADNGCDAPAPTGPPIAGVRSPTLAVDPAIAIAMCGTTVTDKIATTSTTTHEGTTTRTVKDRVGHPLDLADALAVDLDADGTPDVREADPTSGRATDHQTMAWSIASTPKFATLAVAQQGVTGWSLSAVLWSPADVAACPNASRGHVTITDTQIDIQDTVVFAPGDAALSASTQQVLASIAATLNGNPDIREVALRAYATADEPAPLALAERRGLAARKFLVDEGRVAIDRLRIEFYDHGYAPLGVPAPPLAAQRTLAFVIGRRSD